LNRWNRVILEEEVKFAKTLGGLFNETGTANDKVPNDQGMTKIPHGCGGD
jgi:hypothetical protein